MHKTTSYKYFENNRDFMQIGWERWPECYKTIDLITEHNDFPWE